MMRRAPKSPLLPYTTLFRSILEGYGLSETSPVASFSPYGEEPRVGSIGKPVPGVEMKLIEPGGWDEVNPDGTDSRSEEHTSELQSRQYLVCRPLLEKKNKHT